LFASTDLVFPAFTLSLDSVSFTRGAVGSLVGDLDGSAAGFSFTNVVAGDYSIIASGTLTRSGSFHDFAVIGANYTVTPAAPVPEPSTYVMLLAGLGAIGAIARRRNKLGST
jgi:hypothetical protein